MRIVENLKDKRILIWGYGREGKSTENFILTHCNVKPEIFEGRRDDINEDDYDVIIKSPGIKADNLSEKYTSQTQLFLEEFSANVIGITGTKGKSTTSTMLYRVLQQCLDRKVLLVGNIGLPCLDYCDQIEEDTVVVFEMSCHQLASVRTSPHVAVFLNLYEDHLDYYGTREKYFLAKKNITKFQKKGDFYFCGETVPEIETDASKIKIDSRDLGITHSCENSASYEGLSCDNGSEPGCGDGTKLRCDNGAEPGCGHFKMKLKGEHNQFNASFVYEIATKIYGCEPQMVKAAIAEFGGLPHRLEFVGTVNGVDFYNDSISTIPEATIQAATSIANAKTILIGGMDRHIHYEKLVNFIKAHGEYNYILSYESGKRIYEEVKEQKCCTYVEDLKASVELAKKITPKGGACVLSPAAASYGYFKNFEERGETFKTLVLK